MRLDINIEPIEQLYVTFLLIPKTNKNETCVAYFNHWLNGHYCL